MDKKKVISLLQDYGTELEDKRKAAIEPYTVQKLDEDIAEVAAAIGYMKGERWRRPGYPRDLRRVGNPYLCLHDRPN